VFGWNLKENALKMVEQRNLYDQQFSRYLIFSLNFGTSLPLYTGWSSFKCQ